MKMFAKTIRSAFAFVLVAALMLGVCSSPIALAKDAMDLFKEDKDTIVYVSIGDSMTNGYGLDGYDGNSGIVNYANETYSNKFAAWLAGYKSTIGNDQVIFTGSNGTVDHRQLAMSGFRAEDLYWALTLDYENTDLINTLWENRYGVKGWDQVKPVWSELFKNGDYRTWTDLVDADYRYADGAARILNTYNYKGNGSFRSSFANDAMIRDVVDRLDDTDKDAPYFPDNATEAEVMGSAYLQIATEFYQESVKDADIISLALGNTNFGTFMFNYLVKAIGGDKTFSGIYDINDVYALADLEPEMQANLDKLIAELDVVIEQNFGTLAGGNEENLEEIKCIFTYCITSYIVNYIGSIEAILAMNPDVDIIQVALMNAYVAEESEESVEGVTLGDVVDLLYTPVNAFIAAYPTTMKLSGNKLYKEATFYYAEAETVESMVAIYGNDFYKGTDGQCINYPGLGLTGVADFNTDSTVRDRFIEYITGDLFDMLDKDSVKNTFKVTEFVKVDIDQITDYEGLSNTQKALAVAGQDDNLSKDVAISCALYLAFESAIIEAGRGTVTLESLVAASAALKGNIQILDGVLDTFKANIGTNGVAYAGNAHEAMAAIVNTTLEGKHLNVDIEASHIQQILDGNADKVVDYIVDELATENIPLAKETAKDGVTTGMGTLLSTIESTIESNVAGHGVSVDLGLDKDEYLAAAGVSDLCEAILADSASSWATLSAYISSKIPPALSAYVNVNDIIDLSETATALGKLVAGATVATNDVAAKAAATEVVLTTIGTALDVPDAKGAMTDLLTDKVTEGAVEGLCTILALPGTLNHAMLSSTTVSSVLCLAGRVTIGTGIGGHPSYNGHNVLAEEIIEAYEGDYTSADKTLDNLEKVFPDIFAFADEFVFETEALVEELKAIVLANEETVEKLYANLKVMNGEVEKLVAELEEKLAELDEKENKVLVTLKANREALVKELAGLEEKLEAVVNGTYFKSAASDKDALIADTKAAIEATKAAIAELDATIAYVENQIKTDKSGIEAIKADIEVIKANIKATETALAEVVAVVDQLKADLKVLADATAVLYEVAIGQFVELEDVIDAIETIAEVVPVIIENVTELYERGVVAAEKIEAAVEVICGKADAISAAAKALSASTEAWVGVNVEKVEAVADTLKEIKALLEAFVNVNYPIVEDAVVDTVNELKTAIETYVAKVEAGIVPLWENYKDEVFMAAAVAYLYADDKGYVTYVEELVNGYIADAEAMIEDLKADLKDAKIELEAKRAELEAKLPVWKADLAELKAELLAEADAKKAAIIEKAIAEIEAKIEAAEKVVAELEAFVAEVEAHLAEVESALEAVKAALAVVDGDIADLIDALKNLAVALKDLGCSVGALAETVAGEVEKLIGYGEMICEDIIAVIETLDVYCDLAERFADVLKNELLEKKLEVLENLEKVLEQVRDYLVDAIVDAVVKYFPEVADAIYDYLYNNPEEVINFVKTYGPYLLPLVEEYGDEALAVLGYVLYTYGDEMVAYVVENHEAILSALVEWIDVHGENTVALIHVYAEALGLCDAVRDQIADLEGELEKLEAELEKRVEAIKAEIEALKKELETAVGAAKAEIEAKIAALEAELEAIKSSIEAKIAAVKAAIEELKSALDEAIENGLTNLEALKDAILNLDEAVADLIANVKLETVKALEAAIAELDATLEKLLGEVYDELKACLGELAKKALDAVADAVVKYFPEVADEIYDYLYNNPEEVIAFFEKYGPAMLDIAKEYGDEALAVIGYVLYNYGDEIAEYLIENREEIFANIVEWFEVHGENTVALIQVYAEALGLCDAVRAEIAELEALLEQLKAELENATGEVKAAIEAKIAEVKAVIAELKAKLEALENAIKDIVTDVNNKVEDIVAKIENLIAEIENAVEELKANVKALVEEAKAAVEATINAAIEAAVAELEAAVEVLKAEAAKLAEEIAAIVAELVYDATHGEYVIENDSFYVALGDSSAVSKSYVDALAAVLGVDYANLANAGDTTTDTLALIAEQAELLAKADLVTVGYTANIFTAEVTYTLANILQGKPVEAYDWAALVTEDGVEYVEKALAEVRAKLVEQGLDVTVSGKNLADTLVAAVEAYAYRYVEHILTYPAIVNAIHNVAPEALVVIVGLHNTVENIVIDIEGTEIALGEYVQYAVDAANVVSLVNAILVEDTVFVATPDVETLKEEKGDELTYDMISFVMEAIITNGADFATSENGHAYIAEQILNALTVVDTRGLLGDANGDGVVNNVDAMLVLQYDAGLAEATDLVLNVCDVNGDGLIDNVDAMLILQYDALLIEVFPVEE